MALVCDTITTSESAATADIPMSEPASDNCSEQPSIPAESPSIGESKPTEKNQDPNDLEDGEIEDDDEDDTPMEEPAPAQTNQTKENFSGYKSDTKSDKSDKDRDKKDRDRDRDRRRHEEKSRKHMTEAEKSILHLRKREKAQREKWEKFRREQTTPVDPLGTFEDDFAKNIEKTLATILNKKEKEAAKSSEEDNEEKRSRKRKKRSKDHGKSKQRKLDSPKSDSVDENELINQRGGSPLPMKYDRRDRDRSPRSPSQHSDDSHDTGASSDRSKEEERVKEKRKQREKPRNGGNNNKRNKNNRDRNKNRDRDRRSDLQLKDSQGICVFFLQGKCQKGDCPYSHEACPPMKLELCKFYLNDCCAKGDKCSYMHGDFPCKFYHTGLQCTAGENCKFAHGKPLTDNLKQILFKHIETAPRDILGGFPRMSREEALNMINASQKKLHEKYGMVENTSNKDDKDNIPSLFEINIPMPIELVQEGALSTSTATTPSITVAATTAAISDGKTGGPDKQEKPRRKSRWQDPDPEPPKFVKPFVYQQDQDMRLTSNGDVDMRTLPMNNMNVPNVMQYNNITSFLQLAKPELLGRQQLDPNADFTKDIDIRSNANLTNNLDTDIRTMNIPQDVDSRQLPGVQFMQIPPPQVVPSSDIYDDINAKKDDDQDEQKLAIDISTNEKKAAKEPENDDDFENNINWYSDDDDDDENRLTIKDDNDDFKDKDDNEEKDSPNSNNQFSTPEIKPEDVMGKLGDLSKIDISDEVTKLITSMSQSKSNMAIKESRPRDPRTIAPSDPRLTPSTSTSSASQPSDPRLSNDPRQNRSNRLNSIDKPEKVSIYEQGSIDLMSPEDPLTTDPEFRSNTRSDVDLRNLQLPFKSMANYTPATEIDASLNSHPQMPWKVVVVDIPRPDYTGLKLSISDAEKTGDPRLKKIFRLSVDDSPASPKASPKAGGSVRADPRLRKTEEPKTDPNNMTYNQQLSMLQGSAFYQSLTSNQKLLLNQELASRTDQSAMNDPLLNSLLTNLNLLPSASMPSNANLGTALNIIANVRKLNPMLAGQPAPNLINPPVNPTILGQNPNLMNQMAQSMVQPGLLGAAPGIPNIPHDFPINFDPRNGGLLGNAPPQFVNYPPDQPPPVQGQANFNNFNEDFYPQDGVIGGGPSNNFGDHNNNSRDNNRSFNNRDNRMRGRNNNFNRNNDGNNFRNRNTNSNKNRFRNRNNN